jgi:cytidylate kinase
MTVITISREFGSGGSVIAQKVSKALDYYLVDKEFIGEVLSQYGLVEFDKEYDSLPSFWEKFDAQKEARRDMMVKMLNRVVRAVAHQGNVVILGRSGFVILEKYVDVLHVRVKAPFYFRVRQVMRQRNITAYQAEDMVEQGDRVRTTFIKSFYGVEKNMTRPFDLLINTAKISPDLASDWIITAAKALSAQEIESTVDTTASIEVESILATAVAEKLATLDVG